MALLQDELTTTQVAKRLGHSCTSVLRWVKDGHLPVRLTPGGHRRYRLSDVEAFEARMRRGWVEDGPPRAPQQKEAPPIFRAVETGKVFPIKWATKKKKKPGIKPARKASK